MKGIVAFVELWWQIGHFWSCGRRHWLAHPPNQDISLPSTTTSESLTQQLRVQERTAKSMQWDARQTSSKQAARIQKLYARRRIKCCVQMCVCRFIPIPQQTSLPSVLCIMIALCTAWCNFQCVCILYKYVVYLWFETILRIYSDDAIFPYSNGRFMIWDGDPLCLLWQRTWIL
jgi:hypothetical protein